MPDFLTRRNGTWHFVRRVPAEFSTFDKRGIVRHSTKVRVASDRTGSRLARCRDPASADQRVLPGTVFQQLGRFAGRFHDR